MLNPFEPPKADITPVAQDTAGHSGAWRDRDRLVIRRTGAHLPDLCIKSGRPCGARMERKLHWHPKWVYAMLLINIIVFIIVASVTRKTAKLDFALGDEARARRKMHILIGVGLMALGVGLCFGATIDTAFIAIGVIGFFIGVAWALIGARLVWPTRMTDDHAWVEGVSPELLSALPTWRGGL